MEESEDKDLGMPTWLMDLDRGGRRDRIRAAAEAVLESENENAIFLRRFFNSRQFQ
jgi:hypothetical protein